MRLRYRIAIENGICLAVLALAPFLLLMPGLLRGEIPVDALSILSYAPWQEARPSGMSTMASPEANLAAQRYIPWYVFISGATNLRELLWNPLEFAGQPFLAVWHTRCLSPFTIPFYFGDVPTALSVSVFAKLWLAGTFAFFAARRIGLRPGLAMIVAVAFQFSGPLMIWPVMPISDVLPWFPLLLLFAERLALGHYRAWPGGALIVALMLLGGEPEACAALFTFALLYFLFRTFREERGIGGVALSFTSLLAAIVLGIGLIGVQLLPYVEIRHFALDTAGPAIRYEPSGDSVAAWLLPYTPSAASPNASIIGHVGLALLVLAPVWIALRSFAETLTRRRADSLLLLLVLFNVVSVFWLRIRDAIPFASGVNPEHFAVVNGLAFGLAGAIVVDEWLRLNAEEIQSTLKRLVVIYPVVFALLAASMFWTGLRDGILPGPWWSVVLATVFVVATLAILAFTVVRPSARVAGFGLAGVIALDLLMTFLPIVPSTPKDLLFPETPFIAMLKKTGGRVTGSDAIEQWPLAGNGIPQLYGSAGVLMRHQQDYRGQLDKDPLLLRRSGSPLLLLKQEDIQGKFAPIRELLRIEQVLTSGAVLFYDTEAKAHAWMAYEARNVEKYSPDELSSSQPVLLEQGVPPPPLPADKTPGEVSVIPTESRTKVSVQLDGVSKGILVLADAYFPGWKAKIDGENTRVFPVDVLFRGVEVPEGAKLVEFEYDPPLFTMGMLVTGISLAVLLAGALILLPSTIRNAKDHRRWSF